MRMRMTGWGKIKEFGHFCGIMHLTSVSGNGILGA